MVTRASGYHAGFNFGFNVAEAVNFALPRWVYEVCRSVGSCQCQADSVKINMNRFLSNLGILAQVKDPLKGAVSNDLFANGAAAMDTTEEGTLDKKRNTVKRSLQIVVEKKRLIQSDEKIVRGCAAKRVAKEKGQQMKKAKRNEKKETNETKNKATKEQKTKDIKKQKAPKQAGRAKQKAKSSD